MKFQCLETTELHDLGEDLSGKHGILDQHDKLDIGNTLTYRNNTKKQEEELSTVRGTW